MHLLPLLLFGFPLLVSTWSLPEPFINDVPLVPRQGCVDSSLVECDQMCCRPGSQCITVAGVYTCCSPGVPCGRITGACSASSDPMAKCLGFPNFCCPQGSTCSTHAPIGVECDLDLNNPPGPETTTTTSSTSAVPTPTGAIAFNTDPRISYQPADAWKSTPGPSCAKSPSIRTTTTSGAALSFKFNGAIAIRTINSPNGGNFSVSINNQPEQIYTTFSPDAPSCGFLFSKLSFSEYIVSAEPTDQQLTMKHSPGQEGKEVSVDIVQGNLIGYSIRSSYLPNLWFAAVVSTSIAISLI